MENPMRDRIRARLDAMGLNISEAEDLAGLKRGYLYDFLGERKGMLRPDKIPMIAEALDCDPRYLTAQIDTPWPGKNGRGAEIGLEGIIESGAWRTEAAQREHLPVRVAADSRYPAGGQMAFLVRGAGQEELGISAGSIVIASRDVSPRPGDLFVRTRTRAGGEREITLARFQPDMSDESEEGPFTTLGTVVMEMRVF